MARPKKGIIYSLELVLEKLLKTNAALERRLAQMELLLVGGGGARRGRKPGRRRGRKPGPKPKAGRRARKPKEIKMCSVPGCNRKHYAKGLCVSHYQASRRKAAVQKV